MGTYQAYLKKELIELYRNYKLLIISLLVFFFAISTPLILYITPKLLASQFTEGFDVSQLMKVNQYVSIHNYLGDVYQILGLIILFFSLKIITDEFKSQKIVIPASNGLKLSSVYFAKVSVLSCVIIILFILGSAVNWIYSGIVFSDFNVSIFSTLYQTLEMALFLILNVVLILGLYSINLSNFVIMFIVLINYFAAPSLINMLLPDQFNIYELIVIQIRPLRSLDIINLIMMLSVILIISIVSTHHLNKRIRR